MDKTERFGTIVTATRRERQMALGVTTRLWAKLDPGSSPELHPLICHLLDAGHVAVAMWDELCGVALRDRLVAAFGIGSEDLRSWIGYWASLHDIGKATPAFQRLARDTCPEILKRLGQAGLQFPRCDAKVGHDRLSQVILQRELGEYVRDKRLAADLAAALGGHHGFFSTIGRRHRAPQVVGGQSWVCEQTSLVEAVAGHWGVRELPAPRRPERPNSGVFGVLAGLICVADWVASSEELFAYAGADVDVDAYSRTCGAKARDALTRLHWSRPQTSGDALDMERHFGFAPNPMQVQAANALSELTSPGMLVIEYPMGHGKTEAAFAAVHEGIRRLGHHGAYIAMPTQATSDQIFSRFLRDLAWQFAQDRAAQVQLLHGRAALNEGLLALRPRFGGDEDVVASEWFAARKRGLLSPFGVGTIDQGLLAVLQTRHNFVRLFGLAGKVVVFDEVHAYDTYTSTLLDRLLEWLGPLGTSVILLSATLPDARRRQLVRAYSGRTCDDGARYPRMTVASRERIETRQTPSPPAKSIGLQTVPHDADALASRVLERLGHGGCAACICNTVDRAQDVFGVMRQRTVGTNCEVHLLHARYPLARRAELEKRIVEAFGKDGWADGQRPAKAVLVATQVIEQSLDLDFDLMATDLAPVDLVLQRAGRLHRHLAVNDMPTRRPKGLSQARLLLSVDRCATDVPTFGVDERIYERLVLLRSYLALVYSQRDAITVPEDVEELIEGVYGDEPTPAPDAAWQQALDAAEQDGSEHVGLDAFHARCNLIPAPDAAVGLLDSQSKALPEDEAIAAQWEVPALTRKTRPTVQVVCLHEVQGRLCLEPDGGDSVDLQVPPDRQLLVKLAKAVVKLNRREVFDHFDDADTPKAWRKCPLLRHCHPLILRGGEVQVGRTTVRLDADLGVVYGVPAAEEGVVI